MKGPVCKTYMELPLFLNADGAAKVLGIASSSSAKKMGDLMAQVI